MADGENGTLGKLMAVLDLVAQAPSPPRFTDLLARSGEPRGTLHRHLRQLLGEGLAEVDEEGRYRPGLRLLKLAARTWGSNDLRLVARPHLERLQEATGETVHLGVLRGDEIVYLDKVEGRQAIRMYSQVGIASPVYCTGVGKAALSSLGEAERDEIIGRIVFRRFTEATICNAETLRREIADIRALGFAMDQEEHEQGIRCIAAPLHAGGIVGGISITAPAYRADDGKVMGWRTELALTTETVAAELAARLGPGGGVDSRTRS